MVPLNMPFVCYLVTHLGVVGRVEKASMGGELIVLNLGYLLL